MQRIVGANFAEVSLDVTISNADCEDLNGRMGVGTDYGTLIVDFSPTVPGATGMYMDFPNGTCIDLFDGGTPRNWIGGTTGGPLYVQDGKTEGLDSKLPQVFEITSGSKSFLTLFAA